MATEHEKPRVKRTFTTKRKRLEQDLEHVTEEMYRKNLELVSTNRTLSLLRAIDTIVLESQSSLQRLSQQITDAIAKDSNFTHIAIFSKQVHRVDLALTARTIGQPAEVVEPVIIQPDKPTVDSELGTRVSEQQPETGVVTSNLPSLMLNIDSPWLKSDAKELKISLTGESNGLHQVGLTHNSLKQLFSDPLKGVYLLKLQSRDQVVGVMAIGSVAALASFSEADTTLLSRLSEAVGVAIDNRLLFEENQQVLKKLQKTNQKLRALDEAKDEFISMASHQLRTPLTSVKGYLSMVLDGDVGKLTKKQSDLLDQAFSSSQSMVNLIADLLNVSRMHTGKFVIENKVTQLADVVEAEMAQLKETAKGKDQTLTYTKPKKFPELMLDETKIRQVIMNFTDNALHYTPNGGHINVKLEDKGSTIEFTVVDDGLGVPASEQHHLFTKFYRAGNAKQARPDGTGLGLFMAKKVIVSQGGAIIFKSIENKGSVFGFTFPKSKLKPSAADLKGPAQQAPVEPLAPTSTPPAAAAETASELSQTAIK